MNPIGKIARLPESVRQQINERLEDGLSGRRLLAWLNSLGEVKAVLAAEFAGRPVNDQNLCNWKAGGFRDWQEKREALAEAGRIMADGGELIQAGKGALTDNMAIWLVGRYLVASRQLLKNGNSPKALKLLSAFCHDLSVLRRGDHSAEWLRLERSRLAFQQRRQRRAAKKAQDSANPPLPAMDDEEKERRYRQIFGMEPL